MFSLGSSLRVASAALLLPLFAFGTEIPGTVQFNRDVRPILSDKCFACHGPDKASRKTPLRFDQEAGARIELRNGLHALVPGNPEASELYRRITSEKPALRMPPAYSGHERLTDTEIAVLKRWIEQGAVWQKHWSLIPPEQPPIPQIHNSSWVKNPIDSFVLKRLEKEGLKPSPEASRETLIRRVSLDLTGLPPTPAEVEVYRNDRSPEAYEKVVDRLLASPRYGERMAIRWLEAARYSDTNGYQSDGPRDMWRWRDWVLNAFRVNLPFDRFTIEQIAGDLLPNATQDQKIASGFNRNHRTNAEGGIVPEEFRVEYVVDRVDTTSTVWLGLTLGCARCHDHKYDPLSQKDFYSFFAFFNNVPEKGLVYNFGNEEPFIKAPTAEQQRKLDTLKAETKAAESAYDALAPKLDKAQRAWEKTVAGKDVDWSIRDGLVLSVPVDPTRHFDGKDFVDAGMRAKFDYLDPFSLAAWIKPETPNGAILSRMEDYWEGEGYSLHVKDGKIRLHIIKRWTDIGMRVETEAPIQLNRWSHVLATYDGHKYASGVQIYVDGQPQKLRVLFDDLNYPISFKNPFRVGAGGGPQNRFHGSISDVRAYNRALTPQEAGVLPLKETVGQIAALPREKRSEAQSGKLSMCFLDKYAPERIRETRHSIVMAREKQSVFYEKIPTVMVMKEANAPRDTFILKRGAYDAHGDKVTAAVPEVLPALPATAPKNRLGLAKWLVDPSNPLTARVAVNRYWQSYFGVGLVKTVEDFGSQGEWPIHADLLDYLATQFIDSGWDVKAMQRLIVTSATYRQSSKATPELQQNDPENRLLARGPRFRLQPEAIRDQALAVSGLLVEKLGGPSVKPYQPPGLWQELAGGKGYQEDTGDGLYRRSIYTYWKRTVAPPSMVIFDSSTRETCTVRQGRTNTPLQALDLMNESIYLEAARKIAERMLTEGGTVPQDRLDYGWRLVLTRSPKPKEEALLSRTLDHFRHYYSIHHDDAVEFLSQGESSRNSSLPPGELAAYTAVASMLLNLDEAITKE